ncbi:MAG: EAL domain-containing protein [Thauera sp.]|jgi:diguanylate cyclase (GGDEF)-like protein/PAS domain S-box-containing protein
MMLDLLQAIALLLALCLLQGVNARYWKPGSAAAALSAGLIYGLACVAAMMMPIALAPGVIVDPRSVVLSLAALFGGPLTGAVAAVVAGAYRLALGGNGLTIGLVTIVAAVLLGLAYRHGVARAWVLRAPWTLFAFGVLTHLITLLLLGQIPGQSLGGVVATLGLPYLLIMGAGTALLGLLLLDLEGRLATQRALVASEARLRAITAAVPDLLFVVDEDGRFVEVVTRRDELLAVPSDALIGRHAQEILPAAEAALLHRVLGEALASGDRRSARYALDTPAGRRDFQAWVQAMDTPLDGRRAAVMLVQDITQNLASETEARTLAYFDPLTELPNRRLLTERLEHAIDDNARCGKHGALMFIDLDDFKNINDLLGHHNGDHLLHEAGQRLHAAVRDSDTVARFGGDEFVILLEHLAESEDDALAAARHVADKLIEQLSAPYRLQGLDRVCTASLGLVLFNGHGHTADELMQRADLSMYEAKRQGKNTTSVFDPQMRTALATRLQLEAELRSALGTGAFAIHLQPQVDAGGRLIGAEALLRWERAGHGMTPPGVFIPVAEQAGLMPDLGREAMALACHELARWSRLPGVQELVLAVNISAAQIYQPGFVEEVIALLARTGAPAERLKLELTESLLLTDIERAIEAMNRLREMGIRFSIDDFGTGYSSLSYLQRLPLDELKIDRAFVCNLPENANSLAIVRTIMALAEALDIRVVAEGVETAEQHACLLDNGCDAFQGFLFARPEPIPAFEARLSAQARADRALHQPAFGPDRGR